MLRSDIILRCCERNAVDIETVEAKVAHERPHMARKTLASVLSMKVGSQDTVSIVRIDAIKFSESRRLAIYSENLSLLFSHLIFSSF